MDRTLVLALLVCITGSVAAQAYFADDFNDNYIGDWEQRCGSGAWGASGGCATVTTGYTCSALVCPGDLVAEDLVLQTSGTATHVLGFVARLVEGDNGIYAYVSPDHDVARIRLVQGGVASTILGSLTAPYPSGVTYHLTLTCAGPSLSLLIQVPSSGQQWSLSVTDPGPQEGEFGIAAGDEPGASFDWMECTYEASLQVALFSETTDDDMQGQSAGDGDGAFESGEQIELNLGIQNQGSAAMTGAYAVLQSLSSSIVVVGNYGSYGTMQPGETSTASGDFVINAVPFAPMPATHPMRLTVFADGGFSQQLDFDIPLGSGLSCDVESGYSEWVHAAAQPGWGDNWHVSSARNHTSGGAQSFKCGDIGGGDYDNHLWCGEIGPWFNIPHNGSLSFWMWTDAQTYSTDAQLALDGGLIQTGQFDNWAAVTPPGGYPFEIVTESTGPFSPGTGVFSGTYGWQLVTVPFGTGQSGPHRLRFLFGSDNAGTREGWYIDDISVTGPTGIEPGDPQEPLVPLSVSVSPNPSSDMTILTLQGEYAS